MSGVGGQIDFMRGAALGLDGLGKPILAMSSATKKGESKIVPVLKQGQCSLAATNDYLFTVIVNNYSMLVTDTLVT